MPKLTDTQTMLLAHAGRQDSGSCYPLPATRYPLPATRCPLPDALAATDRARKVIAALIKRGFAEERETGNKPEILPCRWRSRLRLVR